MQLEFDHVAVVVNSIAEFTPVLERLTGLSGSPPEQILSQGVDVSFVGAVEVVQPTSPDGGVARFLEKRGPGLHHIAYRTDDLAAVMSQLTREGYQFTSAEPAIGRRGHPVAFIHPGSTGGLLIEFVEKPNPAQNDGPGSSST